MTFALVAAWLANAACDPPAAISSAVGSSALSAAFWGECETFQSSYDVRWQRFTAARRSAEYRIPD
ncbi:MAG TPA: hypothetical protein VGF32_18315 [Streptosporangiaceae bacterium]